MAAYCEELGEDHNLEMELQCVICKDIYDDPVELSCGHNFCRQCILQYVIESYSSCSPSGNSDCPMCRHKLFITEKSLKEMQGNLKLRNIIGAIQENAKNKPSNCHVHQKAYVLFCKDCNDIKCLTCFMDTCKKEHDVEDIDVTASRIRNELKNKKELIEQQRQQLNLHIERCSKIEEGVESLLSTMSQVSQLRGHFMADVEKDLERAGDELLSMDKWDVVKLVESRHLISTMEVPTVSSQKPNIVKGIDEAIECLEKSLSNTIEKLTTAISDNSAIMTNLENDGAEAPVTSPLYNANASNSTNSTRVSTPNAISSSAIVIPSFVPSASAGQYFHLLGNPFSDSVFEYDWDELSDIEIRSSPLSMLQPIRSSIRPLTTFRFGSELVESVDLIGNRFYVSTSEALYSIVDDHTKISVQQGCHYTSCCAVDDTKTLISLPQMVEVHRNDSLFSRASIFSIAVNIPNGSKISCLGVSSSEPKLYFISDERRFCISVWNSGSRSWEYRIQLRNYTEHQRMYTSFKFVVYQNILYISIFNEGKVIAVSIDGDLVWSNVISCRKPNGVFATPGYLYVCDSVCGIVLLDITNGTCKGVFLHDEGIQPWSVAVTDSRLAVVDRYYRHNVSRSPIRVRVYRLPQLMAAYL